ncbi:MAG: hypothetical protein LBJ93_00890 [Clostridiales bacterium]|jgi:hypothetical protein|nr:hypothetical protein [Clostridiales bacterium]
MPHLMIGFIGKLAELLVNSLGKVIGTLVGNLLEFIITNLAPSLITLIVSVVKGTAHGWMPLVIELSIFLIDFVLELTGAKIRMANMCISLMINITEWSRNDELLNMLKWTPLNYYAKGDPSYRIGSVINTEIIGKFPTSEDDIQNTTHVVSENDVQNPYFFSLRIMKQGIMPTALTIFALIVMLELFQIATKTEGMRNSGFEAPFKLMFKVAICKIVLDNTQMILEAIFNAGAELVDKIMNIDQGLIAPVDDSSWDGFRATLMKFDWFTMLMLCLQLLVQCGLFKAANLFIPFLVFGRVLEMYIYIALAPIPFSTFASQELNQIGKNYVKSFISISLRVVVIYLIVIIYSLMMNIVSFDYGNLVALEGLRALIIQALQYSPYAALGVLAVTVCAKPLIFFMMLLMSIMSADKYTNRVCGAMW